MIKLLLKFKNKKLKAKKDTDPYLYEVLENNYEVTNF